MSFDDEIIEDFLIESEENLETLDNCLMAIENGEDGDVDAIFRAMHSVKSAAGFLEIVTLEKIAHSAETSLSFVRDSGRVLTKEDVDVLIESTGVAREILEGFKNGEPFAESDIEALMVRLKAMEQRMESPDEASEEDSHNSESEESESSSDEDVESINQLEEPNAPLSVTAPKPIQTSVNSENPSPQLATPQIKSRPVRRGLKAPSANPSIAEPTVSESVEASPVNQDGVDALSTPRKLGAPQTKNVTSKEEALPKSPSEPTADSSTNQKNSKTPQIKGRPVRKSNRQTDSDKAESHKTENKVNVSTELLDEIINLVGELVVARNQIIRYVEENGLETIKSMVLPISHLTTDIQEKVMKTRMRQIGSAWGRYPRMIRDLGKEIDKNVDLKMVGQETELDRSLLTMLQEPMRHMLRNAVDHGLESTAERIKAGKSPTGTVWLKAYQASGQVVIEISDDGKGLDPAKIADKAIRQGILTEQRAEMMSVEELQKLIFSPGFSTKEAVTNISGRGVGMDVVNTMVSKVSGIIEIDSVVGQGSTFRIRLPLTLAILPALIVHSAENYFAVPQDNLLEIIDLRDGQDKLNELGGAKVYSLRGNLLPLVGLADLTGQAQTSFEKGYILVIQVNSSKFGLVVENILDTEEIVVKPLGKELHGLDLFSGVTIHGNGKIAWIVDAASVALKAQIDDSLISDNKDTEAEEYEDMQSLLRFDVQSVGSIAVDILSVIRVEQVTRKDVLHHSGRFVYSFNGEVIPVFTFGRLDLGDTESFSLIIIEDDGRKIALLAHEIQDVVRQAIHPSPLLKEAWSIGMAILDDVPTAIIAVDSVLECVL